MNKDNAFSSEELKRHLKKGLELKHFSSIDSTNSEARRLIKNGAPLPLLVTAEEQTSGRGRQGKSFYSPKDTGIYMSLALGFCESADRLLYLTSAAAVAVCTAIEKLTEKKPEIKWVNDIYVENKKVCGILCEAVSLKGSTAVIIGIGVNISTSVFPDDAPQAGCLGCRVNRAVLVSEITDNLLALSESGAGSFIDYYRRHSMLIGRDIVFTLNNKKTAATVTGIDDSFALCVVTESGEIKRLTGGEITVRAADNK